MDISGIQDRDLVYLEGTHITTDRLDKKLADKRYGPFKVTGTCGKLAYELELPAHWRRKHNVFNKSLLKPYTSLVFFSQSKPAPPPPILVNDEPEYEVKQILDSCLKCKSLKYFVKWKGYSKESNS